MNTFEHSCESSIIICALFSIFENVYLFSLRTKRGCNLSKKLSEIEECLKLRNLSKTRWTARAESLKAVWKSFEAIIFVLHEISVNSNLDNKTKVQPLGKKCLPIDFIISMYFVNHIMYQTKMLTETLEAEDLKIIDALVLINSTRY